MFRLTFSGPQRWDRQKRRLIITPFCVLASSITQKSGHGASRAHPLFLIKRLSYAAALSRSQQGMYPPLQQAAPLAQHDVDAVFSQQLSALPDDFAVDLVPFIIGHFSPQQPALPSLLAAMAHLPSLQQPSPQHDFPSAILWSLCAAISHLPSLQHPSPQHDLPSAILPSLPIGHLSAEQHELPLALSPAAGVAGAACDAVCAIIPSANTRVTTNTIHFVFMISSSILVARTFRPLVVVCDDTLRHRTDAAIRALDPEVGF